MLPENGEQQNAEKTYRDGLEDAYQNVYSWRDRDDQKVRDNPNIRLQMTLLIPDLGELVHRHAEQYGRRINQDCPFQIDAHAEQLVWMLVEYLTGAEFDQDTRADNTKAHQLAASYAEWYFDWPPAPESEGQ